MSDTTVSRSPSPNHDLRQSSSKKATATASGRRDAAASAGIGSLHRWLQEHQVHPEDQINPVRQSPSSASSRRPHKQPQSSPSSLTQSARRTPPPRDDSYLGSARKHSNPPRKRTSLGQSSCSVLEAVVLDPTINLSSSSAIRTPQSSRTPHPQRSRTIDRPKDPRSSLSSSLLRRGPPAEHGQQRTLHKPNRPQDERRSVSVLVHGSAAVGATQAALPPSRQRKSPAGNHDDPEKAARVSAKKCPVPSPGEPENSITMEEARKVRTKRSRSPPPEKSSKGNSGFDRSEMDGDGDPNVGPATPEALAVASAAAHAPADSAPPSARRRRRTSQSLLKPPPWALPEPHQQEEGRRRSGALMLQRKNTPRKARSSSEQKWTEAVVPAQILLNEIQRYKQTRSTRGGDGGTRSSAAATDAVERVLDEWHARVARRLARQNQLVLRNIDAVHRERLVRRHVDRVRSDLLEQKSKVRELKREARRLKRQIEAKKIRIENQRIASRFLGALDKLRK